MKGAYSPFAVANTFLSLAKREGKMLTPMHLQKLVYFAHGWSLAILNEPLIDSSIQAWEYGPVIPELYRAAKRYGRSPVDEFVKPLIAFDKKRADPVPPDDEEARNLLKSVWELYKDLSAGEMSSLTHQEGTPWWRIWHDGGGNHTRSGAIPDALIAEHFRDLAAGKQE